MKKICRLFILSLVSVGLPLAFVAKADFMTSIFSSLNEAQAFCSESEIACQTIESSGQFYVVHFDRMQGTQSGPRRGKGGDGEGDGGE